MTDATVRNIDIEIQEAKDALSMLEAVERLSKNRDFKRVIENGFFRDEASRVCLLKADAQMANERSQGLLNNRLTGIGELHQYLRGLTTLGVMAQKALADAEQTRDEVLAEELVTAE